MIVIQGGELQTKIARLGRKGAGYIESQILGAGNEASRSATLPGDTESASTPVQDTKTNIGEQAAEVKPDWHAPENMARLGEEAARVEERNAQRRELVQPYIDQLVDAGYTPEQADAVGLLVAANAERMAPQDPKGFLQRRLAGFQSMTPQEFASLSSADMRQRFGQGHFQLDGNGNAVSPGETEPRIAPVVELSREALAVHWKDKNALGKWLHERYKDVEVRKF